MRYHYTCDHGWAAIKADGWTVRPTAHPVLGWTLAWFTDMPVPDRYALGLTSFTLSCERTKFRVELPDQEAIEWWPAWCRRNRVGWQARYGLEGAVGAQPRRWWVSEVPVVGTG